MPRNSLLFIWFRVLFNCRFYYPVYTVLFLDFGLDMTQFAALNAAWAVSIVCLDVPVGALADVLGRRKLVVMAASLMVVEMVVFASLPVGGPWVFWAFLCNRVLSGAAEAFASGADEALAYESIPEVERAAVWPLVMGKLNRWMAMGFIICSLIGAFVYDARHVNEALGWLGLHPALAKATTLKFPIYLCILSALGALATALSMREEPRPVRTGTFKEKALASWRGIRGAAAWIWRTPAPFLLMVMGFMIDSIVRLFYTVSSNYYRYADISEVYFGVISVASSVLALLTSGWMEWLALHRSARFNLGVVIAMVVWGLLVVSHPVAGWWGIALLAPLFLSIRFLQFFLSRYLNEVTDSAHRATVLSFKSLSMNLAYGSLTLLFGWQTAFLAERFHLPNQDLRVFAASLTWWPWWFAGTMVVYLFVARWRRKGTATVIDSLNG